ncbi:cytochrome P450 [Phaeosphaeriaceae sp. PMI808]|nr:cytochrome P450 [Phaeosphaeriaceae sp. PMI808]
MAILTLGALGLAIAAAVYTLGFLQVKANSREPLVIQPKVPFFGHLIGMLLEGPLYLKRISEKYKLPIFTLPMLTGQTYVVTSPTLAVAVQRASSTLDFEELVAEILTRLVGCTQDTKIKIKDDAAKEEGRKRMTKQGHDVLHPPLAAHKILDILQNQLNHFSDYINNVKVGEDLDLYKMIRKEITSASMDSFYGPHNPFALHPELLDSYWDWDEGIIEYAVNILPKITARKAYYGIEACVKGFVEYAERGFDSESLPFIQQRKKLHIDAGISEEQHARLELAIAFAFNSNAGITSFWIINNIFSRPDLLAQIREEIYTNAFEAPGTISALKLRDACPLLNSTWRETMRIIAPMSSARLVTEDTVLADTYLLRKGGVVQIAGGVINSDAEIWGPDVSSFNERRFFYHMNGTKTEADGSVTDDKSKVVHPAAFRAFGGGVSLCPGRHFAHLEVTSFAAVLVLGYDIQPVKGAQKVEWDPAREDKKFPLAVTKPMRGVKGRLVRRKGWEDVKWSLVV